MLSKWLNADPKLLIVDEPTRGIDVGAKAEVHQIIRDLAADGVAVIVISSDLPEVMALADRILVMREGRQMGIFDAERRLAGKSDQPGHRPELNGSRRPDMSNTTGQDAPADLATDCT